jgi:phosphoribosylaminoimidazolecarboxamide formyltransferase/IMP cyclohydrolase
MTKKVKTALISVFYKDGLEVIVKQLQMLGVTIYSTGGTEKFIEQLRIPVTSVEKLTNFPSILGGRVKTLHPAVFGGILGRRENAADKEEMHHYDIPEIDLVIVDLYPFEETLRQTTDEQAIVEKIDIGGLSLIRAAAKNYNDVVIVGSADHYFNLEQLLILNNGEFSLQERREFASKAFEVCVHYDIAISNYFNPSQKTEIWNKDPKISLRYGENPHQHAHFYGDLTKQVIQLHGKDLSYNNLVDIEAAILLIQEFDTITFAIIKHTNVCGAASRENVHEAWTDALAGDPESAFGGVLVCNTVIDKSSAESINNIFFEVLIAQGFHADALNILKSKKNRILLQCHPETIIIDRMSKSVLNGTLEQDTDKGNFSTWKEEGTRQATETEKTDLIFANIICKHLKSNAISLVKNNQLVGKGCGQTSRIDALRQALEKAKQFDLELHGAVMASDAFFPFNDCVKMGHKAGITAFIQPGGSIRDNESIEYCKENNLAMVITGLRHFKH